MKKIYLTFDIETIISRFSFNPIVYNQAILGAVVIAKELAQRNLKGTFFISLSPKTNRIAIDTYLENIQLLIKLLSGFDNIKLQPHLHGSYLPIHRENKVDSFDMYSLEDQIKMLEWSKSFFSENGICVDAFRPGGYKKNENYYTALKKSGFKYSSIMQPDNSTLTLGSNDCVEIKPYNKNGIYEYPVTSISVNSIKGSREILNLSPDFFTLDSIRGCFEQLSYLNINFHSFSMFTNRLGRENHRGLIGHNIKYILFEKPLNTVLRHLNMELINKDTLFRAEFINWLDFIKSKKFETYFIGE